MNQFRSILEPFEIEKEKESGVVGSCSQRKKGLKEGIEVAFLRHFKKRKCLVFLVVRIRVVI